MKPTTDELKARYKTAHIDELLRIYIDSGGTLTEEAHLALTAELAARGIYPADIAKLASLDDLSATIKKKRAELASLTKELETVRSNLEKARKTEIAQPSFARFILEKLRSGSKCVSSLLAGNGAKFIAAICIGSLFLGASILLSGGIYQQAPGPDRTTITRLNKFTGQLAICGPMGGTGTKYDGNLVCFSSIERPLTPAARH